MVTLTVGVGGDYADWGLAWNALVALGLLGDDYDIVQISDVTNNTAFVNYIWPNYNTVRFVCNNRHNGSPNRGYKTYLNQKLTFQLNTFGLIGDLPKMAGTVVVDGLNVENVSASDSIIIRGPEINPAVFGNNPLCLMAIYNCLVKGKLNNDIGVDWGSTEHCGYRAQNLKIWKCGSYGFGNNVRSFSIPDPGYYSKYAENIIVYNCAKDIKLGINFQYVNFSEKPVLDMRNVVSCKTAAYRDCWNVSSTVNWLLVNNCSDSDGTCPDAYGTGIVHNINPVDEFISLDDTNDDFLKLKETADFTASPLSVSIGETVNINSILSGTGQLYQTGSTNIQPWNTEDIAGSQRPDIEGKVSIGAHEQSEIISYNWNLDDGKVSVLKNPSVFYETTGLKTISVTLTYSDGSTETITKVDYITVTGYNLDFIGIPRSGNSPLKTTFYPVFEPL